MDSGHQPGERPRPRIRRERLRVLSSGELSDVAGGAFVTGRGSINGAPKTNGWSANPDLVCGV